MTPDHTNPSLDRLEEILVSARTVAVVGVSSKPHRPSYEVFGVLVEAGYRAIPVNPNETEVHGQRAYPSLEAVGEQLDIVDVFRRAESTPEVARSAVAVGAGTLWLQQGIVNQEAAAIGRGSRLEVVMDLCIAVMIARLGLRSRPEREGDRSD